MTSPKLPNLLQILKHRQQEEFVGRENQLALFERNLALPYEQRRFVFGVSGPGGIGKTSLLRQFRKIAETNGAITTWVDENETDLPTVMARISEGFERRDYHLSKFSERFEVYRQRRNELEGDPEAPAGLATFLGRTLAKTGVHLARRAPGVGVAFEFVDEDTFATQAAELVNYIARKVKNKDEIKLMREPIETLTPLFLEDLRKLAVENSIGLFFDTYERIGEYVDDWLRAIIDERYGEVPASILFSIAGQNELDKNKWAPYEGIVTRFPLDLFTEGETKNYLQRKGIVDERVIELIINLSGRLPLLIATLATESPSDPKDIGDPSGTAVERFLKWVDDPHRRQIAVDAALPREMNLDLLNVVLGEHDSEGTFAWLKKMPFVRDDGHKYHSVVRSQMLRHKRRDSPEGWADLHLRLADYFHGRCESLADALDKAHIESTWQQYSLENLYHRLCNSPQKGQQQAIEKFLEWFDSSRRFARAWADTIKQAGTDCDAQSLIEWGDALEAGVKAYEERDYAEAANMFTKLLEQGSLDESVIPFLLDYRGFLLTKAEQYQAALSDLTKAVELKPTSGEFFLDRARLLRSMERLEESIHDFGVAIELDGQSARAFAGRATSYYESADYDNALADFERAIGLRDDYSWALFGRARTYIKLGLWEKANQDFERAVEIEPDYEHVFQKELGLSFLSNRLYSKANEALKRAVRSGPRCFESWESLARSLKSSISIDETVKELRAIEIPDEAWAYVLSLRGEAFRRIGLNDQANEDFTKALEFGQTITSALRGRSLILLERDQNEEALRDINECIEIEPTNSNNFSLRGKVLQKLKRSDDAILDYRTVLEMDSASGHQMEKRIGGLLLDLGRYHEAQEAFLKSLSIAPSCGLCWWQLAKICKHLHPTEMLSKVLESMPLVGINEPAVMAARAGALADMGSYEEAFRTLDNAMSLDETIRNQYGNSKGLLLTYLGRYEDAIEIYRTTPSDAYVVYNIAVAMSRWKGPESASDQIAKARERFESQLEEADTRAVALYGLAGLQALEGNDTIAMDLLEQSISLDASVVRWALNDIAWRDLREVPRFQGLLSEHT